MRAILVLLALFTATPAAHAALYAQSEFLGTVDNPFGRDRFDIYSVLVTNTFPESVTTIEMSIPGINLVQGLADFHTEASLTGSFGALPEAAPGVDLIGTFLITPGDLPVVTLPGESTDTLLQAAFSPIGTDPVIEAKTRTAMATISVPAGTPFALVNGETVGGAVVQSQSVIIDIIAVPEPTGIGLLVVFGAGLAGAVRRR